MIASYIQIKRVLFNSNFIPAKYSMSFFSGYGFCTNNDIICNSGGQCLPEASGVGSHCKPNPEPVTHHFEFVVS